VEKSTGVESTTFTGYAQALRKIVADSFGIESTNKRFGSRGGYLEWVAQVNAVELAALTPALVQVWKRAYLAKHDDPVKTRSAKVSVNSFMRRARSLFSDKMLRHLGFEVQNPFEGVEFESRPSLKYRSTFDIKKLAQAAIKLRSLAKTIRKLAKSFSLRPARGCDVAKWMRWNGAPFCGTES
jgi:hypothetical protein